MSTAVNNPIFRMIQFHRFISRFRLLTLPLPTVDIPTQQSPKKNHLNPTKKKKNYVFQRTRTFEPALHTGWRVGAGNRLDRGYGEALNTEPTDELHYSSPCCQSPGLVRRASTGITSELAHCLASRDLAGVSNFLRISART